MHMSDALLSPTVAGVMFAATAVTAVYCFKKANLEENQNKIPLLAILGALVFATQMINFTIPGTGSSGHLCGGMLLAALLGPYAAFLTMICVLLIQCFIFADGGVLALGANVFNMGFYGCFVGGFVIWKLVAKSGLTKGKIVGASVLGSIVALQLGAFSVTLETLASGITDLPFSVFLSYMQPIHLAIGLGEGLISAAVLVFVFETRPELLWANDSSSKADVLSYKQLLVVLGVAALVISGLLSLYASAFPDGLEWSLEAVTGSAELPSSGSIYESASSLQESTAVLPDYAFKDSDSALGTSFSGVVGCAVVFLLAMAVAYGSKAFKAKQA